jgi:octopine/nopaline transport system permease protein
MLDLLRFGADGWGDELARAALMTLLTAIASYGLGLSLGGLAALAQLYGPWWVRGPIVAYTTMARGTPPLLVIWLLFFGGNHFFGQIAAALGYGGRVELSAFGIGVMAIGLICAAYAAEAIRGAIQAVPKGQMEAARALGMGRRLAMRRIIIPQALRHALPGLGNVWQMTLKDTTLVSVVALVELMRQAFMASQNSRQPFLFYGIAAIIYMAMTSCSALAFRYLSRRAERGVRRAAT